MKTATIENERLRIVIIPDYGARVVSLVDKRSGREWMVQGPPSANAEEEAVYGAAEAVGWDECFPTVAPWRADGTVWGRRLRDHGDLWGRPWAVLTRSATTLTTVYSDDIFRFTRGLTLEGDLLSAAYEVENRTDREMPYLWALHGLLAVTAADRIEIAGVDQVSATYLANEERVVPAQEMSWPDTGGALPFMLDRVQLSDRRFAGKFYSRVPVRRASVGHDAAFLTVSWDAGLDLGIWLNYGGWPNAGGLHHLALEPTSAMADGLGEAVASGAAVVVPPNGRRQWNVSLTTSRELRS